MAEAKKLIPKRRFKEFQNAEEWKPGKISDLVDVCSGRDYKHLTKGDIPVYGTGGYMLSVNEALSYKNDAIGIGRKGTIDKPYILKAPFWTVDTLFYALPREFYNIDFIFCVFQNIDWRQKDESSGVPSLSKVAINNTGIFAPYNMEQEKIGKFLTELDNLITLQQRKLEKMKSMKKAYLYEMFPAEGESKPKRRFKGFTGDWEKCKLSKIADVRDGTHDSPKYVLQGHPFVTSKNVGGGYINYDDIQYISDDDFKEINKRSKVDVNDILIGMIGTIGNIALVRREPDFAIKNVALIKDTKQVNYLYLYHYLQSSNVVKQLSDGMDGGTQKFIALGKIRELNIMVPSEQEQLQLGTYFENIDNLITLHQSKLDKLKNLKKAYLSEMFI